MLLQAFLTEGGNSTEQGRVSCWEWYFAQKVMQINKEINAENDLDKKKLVNKRTKLLNKMNRVHEQ